MRFFKGNKKMIVKTVWVVYLMLLITAVAAVPAYADGKDSFNTTRTQQDQNRPGSENTDNVPGTEGIDDSRLTEGSDEIHLTDRTDEIHLTDRNDDIHLTDGTDDINLTDRTDDIHLTDRTDEIHLTDRTDDIHLTDRTDDIHLTDRTDDINLTDGSADLDPSSFMVTRLYDYDSDLTLGRGCIPSDFLYGYDFLNSLSDTGECSIACPFQVVLTAANETGTRNFMYRSEMYYLYPPSPEGSFHEGMRYGVAEHALIGYPTMVMLYPRAANEYADYLMEKMDFDATVYYDETVYVTDKEDAFLAQKSKEQLDYYNVSNPLDFLFNVKCTDAFTSYTESSYYVDDPVTPLSVKIITSTTMLHFYGVDNITGATCEYGITYVPYLYMCMAPASEKEEAFAQFDVFAATTRTTDEFTILNRLESQMLQEIVGQGWTLKDEKELVSQLGTGYGTYDIEQFSDYIFDQNDYTTSDGRSFKVPTSYDYVYETNSGEIYVTNTTEQPAGSTRLYAN